MRSRRVRLIATVAVILVVLVAGVYIVTHPEPTDEEKIVRLVAQGQRAVENRNSTGLTSLISRDYFDKSGLTRQQIVALIVQWLRGGEEMVVVPQITGLQIREPFADMTLKVRVVPGRDPSGAGLDYDMSVRLRKEGRHWKVISAEGWGAAQSDVLSGE